MQTVFVSVETDVIGTFAVSVQIELLVFVVTMVSLLVPVLVLYDVPTELKTRENSLRAMGRELRLPSRDCLNLGVGFGIGFHLGIGDSGDSGVGLRRKIGGERRNRLAQY